MADVEASVRDLVERDRDCTEGPWRRWICAGESTS
jgi:hypothetical protein